MWNRHSWLTVMCAWCGLLLNSVLAHGNTIFSENFQGGSYPSWTLSGNGHDAANYYAGNYSMRLDGLRQGTIAVSSQGYSSVSLSMDLAALYLVSGDYCYAEYSTNGGTSWNILNSLGVASATGAMHTATVSSGLENNPNLQLRFRAYTLYNHYCYGDNVSLSGTPIGSGVYDPLTGNGSVSRTQLTYTFLTTGGTPSLIDYSHYALPANAANPTNTFQGRLTLSGQASGGNAVEVDSNNNLPAYPQAAQLPSFAFDFVQDGTHFIPVTRGKIEGTHPSWALVLEPGRVWNENGDNGYSRVALPFSLQERNQDCVWNGVMTFLFKNDGSISNVVYQNAGETCKYLKVNFWGRLGATYVPATVANAAAIKSAYEAEVARRMPVKPIAALATDYPASGVVVANIGSDVTAADMTIYGVAYNGVHYVGGCQTRYGTYPFCEVLDVPSYSTAKSVFGAYGLMRLEQKYTGTQRTLRIRDYVSECSGTQWNMATLESAMDMATGNYDSSTLHADEASTAMLNGFFLVTTHAQKVSFACGYTNKSTPGTTFVYHTSDTYLLGRAMNMYYKAQAGSSADFFNDVVVGEIYKPLGLSPTTYTTLRTQDSAAQAHTGFGLIYVRDDVVKLAEFMGKAQGKIQGTQTLDSSMVAATLNLGSGGLQAGTAADRYNNGFWYYDLHQSTSHNFSCSGAKWIPYMSGYGGISVVLMPNGMVYYNFSDNDEYTWLKTAVELDKIAALCP
ncbi:hypothetical protein [Rudaea sp.]|uniref:hypothetical protein n=1 Tax=Rudaea sp. TaxID=2136325 RepID=UPI0037842859